MTAVEIAASKPAPPIPTPTSVLATALETAPATATATVTAKAPPPLLEPALESTLDDDLDGGFVSPVSLCIWLAMFVVCFASSAVDSVETYRHMYIGATVWTPVNGSISPSLLPQSLSLPTLSLPSLSLPPLSLPSLSPPSLPPASPSSGGASSLSAGDILAKYFPRYVQHFPSALTFRPSVNCSSGRYLLVQWGYSDGFGSTSATYFAVQSYALRYDLTLIAVAVRFDNFSHPTDPADTILAQWLGIHDFNLPKEQWESCSESSPVRSNIVGTVHIRDYSLGSKLAAYSPGTGLTVVMSESTKYWGGGVILFGLAAEIRYHALHPYLPSMTGLPVNAHFMRRDHESALFREFLNATDVTPESVVVTVHVRRGDITPVRFDDVTGERHRYVTQSNMGRVIADDAFVVLIRTLHTALPAQLQRRMYYVILSEGEEIDYYPLMTALHAIVGGKLSLRLNGPSIDAVDSLARSDVVIGSLGSFSLAAGAFNSESIKIMPSPEPRAAGVRGILSATLQTDFPTRNNWPIPQNDLEIWRQKINFDENQWLPRITAYVQRKDANLSTAHDAFAENYRLSYPREQIVEAPSHDDLARIIAFLDPFATINNDSAASISIVIVILILLVNVIINHLPSADHRYAHHSSSIISRTSCV